jgi:uncharacterized protein
MKILFALNHPAHFHLFKNSAKELLKNGHNVLFVYKQKDILEILLKDFDFKSIKLTEKAHTGRSKFSMIKNRLNELIVQDINLLKIVRKFLPDLMAGTDISITHIGRIYRIPTLVFNEDDFEINRLFCYSSYPFASQIISPLVCNVGNFQHKKVPYEGYQKLAYLHPKRFVPDKSIVEHALHLDKPYYLIRLVSFTAGHDFERKHGGLTEPLLHQLIDKFSSHGNVYISSEIPVKKEYEKFLLRINPLDIHHFLFFADVFIADSQSMIVESAILGTPSIRFNSFVGQISVLEELEHKYHLTFGCNNKKPELLLAKIDELLIQKNLKYIFRERQKLMLQDKIDLTAFIVWLIENYPESAEIMKEDMRYQDRFRGENIQFSIMEERK